MHTEPPDAPPAPLGEVEEIRPLWEAFRGGGIALCPRDARPMALSVDGVANCYRFACVNCGLASAWFEAKFADLGLRGTLNPETPPSGG